MTAADPRARGPARPAAGSRCRRAAADVQRGRRARRRRRARGAAAVRAGRRGGRPLVALAVAFVVRAVRGGSVCVDLATVADRTPSTSRGRMPTRGTPPLPPALWSPRDPPVLRLLEHDGVRLLYLDRYWREEEQVHADLVDRPAGVGDARRDLAGRGARPRLPGGRATTSSVAAARVALTHATTVLTGGPGTGKTTTVAALLALCAEQAELAGDPAVRIALAAPTGKAAARLQQAVEAEVAKLPDADREPAGRRPGGHPAPAARRPARHVVPVPAPPRQPAAPRRGRRRRDLDGLADDDGPPARGGPARQPADPGRRPVPARVGRGRRGARRPGRDACRRRPSVGVASLVTSHRFGESIGALAEAVRSRRRRPGRRPARGGRRPRRAGPRRRPRAPHPRARRPRTPSACSGPPRPATPTARWRCWTGGGCCARTARGRSAYATGTPRSSAGWARRPGNPSSRPGTPAARSW